jgi:alpha-N-arabinofuranosidase
MKKQSIFLTALMLLVCIGSDAQQATPKLTLKLDNADVSVSPTLYGLMTEEINYSYEGGLYAQLIRNVSFKDMQGDGRRGNRGGWPNMQPPKPAFWSLADSATASMRVEQRGGINEANQSCLCLDAKSGSYVAGIENDGYWGFPVRPNTTFKGALYAKSDVTGNASLTVSLVSLDGKTVYATSQVKGLTANWQKLPFSFTTGPKVAPTKDVRFLITVSDAGKYWFTRVTLFPPTFNNRANGLRADLMTMLKDMKPKFLRFPGGNYLEGNTFSERFNWKKTVGDPDQRPGHQSPWGYRSTDGMGLLEFLEWSEDVGGEPLLAVFAGYVLNRDHLEGDALQPFINDALDEIEYVIGGSDTKWGAQRIRDGHPEPFKLHYVEIGNEDWFDGSGSYTQRYRQMYEAIKAKYPQLQLISTIGRGTNMANSMDAPGVKIDIIDEHYYRGSADMYRAAFQYDKYDRKGPKVFCGEWATREGKPTTNMNAALGDAAWMTCMERNSDVVIASCYAPLFVNVNPGGMQWESDLIGYDALNAYGSPSYYAQAMFGNYLGDKVVPVEGSDVPQFALPMSRMDSIRGAKPSMVSELYYVATKDTKTGLVNLKVVNAAGKAQPVAIGLDGNVKVSGKALKVELKAAHPEDTNTIENPNNIIPVKSKIKVAKSFTHTFAPYSVTVLQFVTK